MFDILNKLDITHVIATGEAGMDKFGLMWAKQNRIPVTIFQLNPYQDIRKARFTRNARMVEHIKLCGGSMIFIKDGTSKGSKNLLEKAEELEVNIIKRKIKEIA